MKELLKIKQFLTKRIAKTEEEHAEAESNKDIPTCMRKGSKLTAYKETLEQVNQLLAY